jgi:ornithine cyclodeaminase
MPAGARLSCRGDQLLPPIYIAYLNRLDIEELKITDDEILSAVEASLASQGRGETVIEPRVHLEPGVANGHFNVLRGAIKAPIDSAGVKIVGDFVDNYKLGFPSELAILALFDPRTGAPKAILDASGITDMRTGAVTAIGAKHLPEKIQRPWAISARGEPPTGTCVCSTTCSISTRSGFTPAAKKAATVLRSG